MNNEIVVKFIPAVSWNKRAKWQLKKAYTSHNKKVKVPKDFITDGASIPFYARMFFSPTGIYFGAAIVHDYVLVTKLNWAEANIQFEAELDALKIAKWRKLFLLVSVKTWGSFLRVIGKKSINE